MDILGDEQKHRRAFLYDLTEIERKNGKEVDTELKPREVLSHASKNRISSLGRHSERGQGNDETWERRL